jgi:hypothetical protein
MAKSEWVSLTDAVAPLSELWQEKEKIQVGLQKRF